MPFPSEETTPPVMKMNRVLAGGSAWRSGAERFMYLLGQSSRRGHGTGTRPQSGGLGRRIRRPRGPGGEGGRWVARGPLTVLPAGGRPGSPGPPLGDPEKTRAWERRVPRSRGSLRAPKGRLGARELLA